MASITPRNPEQYYHQDEHMVEFNVSELAAGQAGGLSPYGEDAEFPLPLHKLNYQHPGPADRPNLIDGD